MTIARQSKSKITPLRRRVRIIGPRVLSSDLDSLFLYREVIRTDLGRRLVEASIAIRSKVVREKLADLVVAMVDEPDRGQGDPP